jgi:ADP-ribose pyrophosphatase YjhB (NUDIX family)
MKKVNTSGDDSAVARAIRRPVLAASTAVFRGREVLLVKRGQKLGQGLWSLPGGKVELAESVAEAAAREVFEETGIRISIIGMAGLYEIITPELHYAIAAHAAIYQSGEAKAGSDAAEARFVGVDEIATLTLAPNTLAAITAARKLCQI